jgi:UDP-N-acetylmuramoyl-tripeptide--D-alanyl-D-alanine ligase
MMTLAEAHALLPQSILVADAEAAQRTLLRVHSDTRTLRQGDLFVALRGERFDAHEFLDQAQARGALAALAEQGLSETGLPGLQVPDTREALGQLAAAWRRRFDIPLIAVTGSNGKTTVTQMIASILRAWVGDGAFSTEGNFNNDIGVPLTLLRLRQDDQTQHRAGVIELGMNHPGEIARLAEMTAPTVALVNNAQREHQEFMSSVEAVARENACVLESLPSDGVAVFPADDEFSGRWRDLAGARRQMTFALSGDADVTCTFSWDTDHWDLVLNTPVGQVASRLNVAGLHNVKNALAATACALAAGCPLEAVACGLAEFLPVKGRSQIKTWRRRGQAITLIDDTYNANPDSVRAAIDVLAALPGPRWLVLGDMGEVGEQGPAFHHEVGTYAQMRGVHTLWVVGPLCVHAAKAFDGARHFEAVDDLTAALSEAPTCSAVVVKGSRFMKMEHVVSALLAMSDSPSLAGV